MNSGKMRTFVTRHRRGQTTVLLAAQYGDATADALSNPAEYCEPLDLGGGRGGLFLHNTAEGERAVIREFRRGGMVRHFIRDSYVIHNRPLAEWEATLTIFEMGLPICEPIGVAFRRSGPFFRGAIATRFVDAPSLKSWLERGEEDADRLEQVGHCIARFHDRGVYHADLNAANILMDDGAVRLLDWDRAQIRPVLDRPLALGNLDRLARSLKKLGFPEKVFASISRGYHCGFETAAVQGLNMVKRPETHERDVLEAIDSPEEHIKTSSKAVSSRHRDWYVKRTASNLSSRLRCATKPGKFRMNLDASLRLERAGILVPKAIAYAEQRMLGALIHQSFISEWLNGYVNVEVFAKENLSIEQGSEAVQKYLEALANEVRKLDLNGIVHADLSGKNIFTQDGLQFVFIDLDAVTDAASWTDEDRLKRDIQLYDSFCDLWDDEIMEVFVIALHEDGPPREGWFDEVRSGQAQRRARTEAIWRAAAETVAPR